MKSLKVEDLRSRMNDDEPLTLYEAWPVNVVMPFEKLMAIKGVPVDETAKHRRSLVHVHNGSWHFTMACGGMCSQ